MTFNVNSPLVDLLSGHRAINSFDLREWDLINRQARAAKLLASLTVYTENAEQNTEFLFSIFPVA